MNQSFQGRNTQVNILYDDNVEQLTTLIQNYIQESNYNMTNTYSFFDKLCLYFYEDSDIPDNIKTILNPIKNNTELSLFDKLKFIINIIENYKIRQQPMNNNFRNYVNTIGLQQIQPNNISYLNNSNRSDEDPTNMSGGLIKRKKSRKSHIIKKRITRKYR